MVAGERLRPSSENRSRIDGHVLAYWGAAAALVILLLAQALNEPWSGDFWVHLGTVREIADRPWDPRQPFVGVDIEDPLLSPYMLVLGLASRWSRADAITVLAVAGFINLGLWLYAFRRFVLIVTGNRGAPVWALLFTLFAWGIAPWPWSGYFNLNSIGFVLPYPSMFASGVAMLALSSVHRWLVRGHRRDLAVVGLAGPLVLLTHPFTAVWGTIAGFAIIATELRKDRLRRLTVLMGVAGVGAGLALLWPLYSLLRLFGIADQFDSAHRELFGLLGPRSFLALPGFLALALRARRNTRDPLVLTFAGTALVFALGGLTARWSLGRVFPGMMLATHVALGDSLARLRLDPEVATRRRRQVTSAAALLITVGLAGSYQGLIHVVPRNLLPDRLADRLAASRLEAFRPLRNIIGPDDRVVASLSLNLPVGGISGDVLVPPVPTFLDDVAERSRDAAAILSPLTKPTDRQVLIDRWDIRFLVLTPADASALYPSLSDTATVVIQTDSYTVLDVSAVLVPTATSEGASEG